MRYRNCYKEKFLEQIGNKKIICVGASRMLQRVYSENKEWMNTIAPRIDFFVDNDSAKWNTQYRLGDWEYQIYPFDKLENLEDVVLIITTWHKLTLEIAEQLNQMKLNDIEVYSLLRLVANRVLDDSVIDALPFEDMPILNKKLIHTFWFSKEEIPEKYRECMESWKRFCPDYEIKIWNGDTYDVTKNAYMKEAFVNKKWAFVSDYARLDVVYQYGGIYLDMDVLMMKNVDDLLKLGTFFGIDKNTYIDLGTGFGAGAGNTFIKKLLEHYDNLSFYNADGSLNTKPQPALLIDLFTEAGFERKLDSQKVGDIYFVSPDYMNYSNNHSFDKCKWSGKEYLIHCHNGGWVDIEEKVKMQEYRELLLAIESLFEE